MLGSRTALAFDPLSASPLECTDLTMISICSYFSYWLDESNRLGGLFSFNRIILHNFCAFTTCEDDDVCYHGAEQSRRNVLTHLEAALLGDCNANQNILIIQLMNWWCCLIVVIKNPPMSLWILIHTQKLIWVFCFLHSRIISGKFQFRFRASKVQTID